jgi:hypothetical protein
MTVDPTRAAWRQVYASLPAGWTVTRVTFSDGRRWHVSAVEDNVWTKQRAIVEAVGDTQAEALGDLARLLGTRDGEYGRL